MKKIYITILLGIMFTITNANKISTVQIGPADGNGNYVCANITFVTMQDGSYFWFDHSEQNSGKAMLAVVLAAQQNDRDVDVYTLSNAKYFKSASLTGPAWFKNFPIIEVLNEAKSISFK